MRAACLLPLLLPLPLPPSLPLHAATPATVCQAEVCAVKAPPPPSPPPPTPCISQGGGAGVWSEWAATTGTSAPGSNHSCGAGSGGSQQQHRARGEGAQRQRAVDNRQAVGRRQRRGNAPWWQRSGRSGGGGSSSRQARQRRQRSARRAGRREDGAADAAAYSRGAVWGLIHLLFWNCIQGFIDCLVFHPVASIHRVLLPAERLRDYCPNSFSPSPVPSTTLQAPLLLVARPGVREVARPVLALPGQCCIAKWTCSPYSRELRLHQPSA